MCRLIGKYLWDCFFKCNIIQFGTDQLRDAPTRYFVLILYAIYWCDSIVNLLTISVSLPGKNLLINQYANHLYVDKLKMSLLVTACGCFVALSILVVFTVHKKKHWLLSEHLRRQPCLYVDTVYCKFLLYISVEIDPFSCDQTSTIYNFLYLGRVNVCMITGTCCS